MISTLTRTNLGREGFISSYPYGSSWRETRAGAHSRKWNKYRPQRHTAVSFPGLGSACFQDHIPRAADQSNGGNFLVEVPSTQVCQKLKLFSMHIIKKNNCAENFNFVYHSNTKFTEASQKNSLWIFNKDNCRCVMIWTDFIIIKKFLRGVFN